MAFTFVCRGHGESPEQQGAVVFLRLAGDHTFLHSLSQ
jgi:hypothetical protein